MQAVVLAGLGYAKEGILAKEIGGILVICRTLVISIPILLLLAVPFIDFDNFAKLDAYAWEQFLFLSFVNSLIGFFLRFKGMAMAGVSYSSEACRRPAVAQSSRSCQRIVAASPYAVTERPTK